MRNPLRWYPFSRAVLIIVGLYGGFSLPNLVARWNGVPVGLDDVVLRDTIVLLAIFAFGALRAGSLHPLVWAPYGRWLARTPWTVDKPLPMGPIQLVPLDGAAVGLLTLLAYGGNFSMWRVPLVFLCGYLAILAWTMARTQTVRFAYLLAFGLGLVVRFWYDAPVALLAAVLLYPLALVGLRLSLAGFPWSVAWLKSDAETNLTNSSVDGDMFKEESPSELGWPFGLVRPNLESKGISPQGGFLLSLLLGWWIYCFAAALPADGGDVVLAIATIAPFPMAFVRLMRYCQGYASPINLWGRICTLRPIVPGYDKVFVTPLVSVMVVALGGSLLALPGMQPIYVVPIIVSTSLLVLFNGGPTLEAWRHTGNHRIVPIQKKKVLIEI